MAVQIAGFPAALDCQLPAFAVHHLPGVAAQACAPLARECGIPFAAAWRRGVAGGQERRCQHQAAQPVAAVVRALSLAGVVGCLPPRSLHIQMVKDHKLNLPRPGKSYTFIRCDHVYNGAEAPADDVVGNHKNKVCCTWRPLVAGQLHGHQQPCQVLQ